MIIKKFSFILKSDGREQFIPISEEVNDFVQKVGENIVGVCKIFVPHTTAAVIVNQNVNPDVMQDFQTYLESIVPVKRMLNVQGNSDAHFKSSLLGTSVEIPISNGKLELGEWQALLFAEFDGPRTRTVVIQIWGQ
ncbi:MAG: secondary thiamine-phosphate synthase enzyme YjbQ [Promethearchaeota archaeon]